MQIDLKIDDNAVNTNTRADVQLVPETDYSLLHNKPTLNGKTLEGDFILGALDVGAVPIVDRITNSDLEKMFGGL